MFFSAPTSERAAYLDGFQRAQTCLADRDFDGARRQLDHVLRACPDDGGARSLYQRCERYAADRRLFDQDFDGSVRVLTSK